MTGHLKKRKKSHANRLIGSIGGINSKSDIRNDFYYKQTEFSMLVSLLALCFVIIVITFCQLETLGL